MRQDFSNTEDERSTPTPQVGTCHPTATIREWTGWQPVPPGRRSPLCGDAAPSMVVFGQVKETGAALPYIFMKEGNAL